MKREDVKRAVEDLRDNAAILEIQMRKAERSGELPTHVNARARVDAIARELRDLLAVLPALALVLLTAACGAPEPDCERGVECSWRDPGGDPVANARAVGEPPRSMCDLSDDGTGHARTQQLRGCWEAAGVRCSVCNYTCTLPGIVCVASCAECPNPPAPGGAQPAPASAK